MFWRGARDPGSALVVEYGWLCPLEKGVLETHSRDGQAEKLNCTIDGSSNDLHNLILDYLFNTFRFKFRYCHYTFIVHLMQNQI